MGCTCAKLVPRSQLDWWYFRCLWLLVEPLVQLKNPDGSSSFEFVYQLFQTVKDHKDALHSKEEDHNKVSMSCGNRNEFCIDGRRVGEKLRGLFRKEMRNLMIYSK